MNRQERKINFNNEVHINDYTQASDVIGKYAYNKSHDFGGIVTDVDESGISVEYTYHPTFTGDSVFDSIWINGFKIYEYEED